jgi:hypothetical protein
MDLDALLDPARLAALLSARPKTASSEPAEVPALPATLPAAPGLSAVPALPAVPAAPAVPAVPGPVAPPAAQVTHAGHAAGTPVRAIDVHAHLRELLGAIEHELGSHFDRSSPPRRALDVHIELLRTRLSAAWPADAVPTPEARTAALAGALPLLDQIEDLLEALLRAGPWNASGTGGIR